MPHAFFGEMYAERRPFWNTAIRGAVGTAQKYWETISGSELFKLHPALRGVTDFASLDNHIPLGLHGDGGSFSHQDSLFVLSFNSLVSGGSGQGFARRFLIIILRKTDITPETWGQVWHAISWSMNQLMVGITPSENWENIDPRRRSMDRGRPPRITGADPRGLGVPSQRARTPTPQSRYK